MLNVKIEARQGTRYVVLEILKYISEKFKNDPNKESSQEMREIKANGSK